MIEKHFYQQSKQMGVFNPKEQRKQVRGGIYIQLEQTVFMSNQIIRGLININLEEPFQGHVLSITLNGKEETQFTIPRQRKAGNQHQIMACQVKGFNNFLNFTIPIYDFSQGSMDHKFIIQPCQVVIPFELVIGDKLPSSMQYSNKPEEVECSIKYTLVAQIIPTEDNLKPIEGVQEIFIGQQFPSYYLHDNFTSTQQPILCGCYKSGRIIYNVTTNSNSFSPNEQIIVKLDVDFNQYRKKVKYLNVKLAGLLTVKVNDTDYSKQAQIYEQTIRVDVNEQSRLLKEVQLSIPHNITLSSQSSLIKVDYNLLIYPEIDTSCVVSYTCPHKIEIFMNPSQDGNQSGAPQLLLIKIPQNWNPTQLQPSEFNEKQISQIKEQQNSYFQKESKKVNYSEIKEGYYTNESKQTKKINKMPNIVTSQIDPINQPLMTDQNK
ncbi:arrestin (macronuclear) [Tetrahymena thermophila SB210]|uniref:Arrestin n=1 Tax=Tetrahymena thermophila (strain SB210) TaxID=312017 RepID=Q23YH2_TETTS|nr:arrestin [Tetrahymena thermophila SB210]EAS01561.2 arrestin [Tetrahymena thermophila SB210]|eukprot:XP_001021806.2 arrestin [Tetrahymena thermophila SB210]